MSTEEDLPEKVGVTSPIPATHQPSLNAEDPKSEANVDDGSWKKWNRE